MSLVMTLLVLLLVVVIAYAILNELGLPANVKRVVALILAVIFLIYLLQKLGVV